MYNFACVRQNKLIFEFQNFFLKSNENHNNSSNSLRTSSAECQPSLLKTMFGEYSASRTCSSTFRLIKL